MSSAVFPRAVETESEVELFLELFKSLVTDDFRVDLHLLTEKWNDHVEGLL